MHLHKFIKILIVLTVLALAYIHMQMQIVDLAYAGNKKEQRIKKLIEMNGSATYKILMMKSANHLGDVILDDGSDMQFADEASVVRIETPQSFIAQERPAEQSRLAKRTNSFLNLVSFGLVAEARSSE